jgi:hypothetical protein
MDLRKCVLVVLLSGCNAMVGEVTGGLGGGTAAQGGGAQASGGGSAMGGGSASAGGGSASSGGGAASSGGGSPSSGGGSASAGGGAASTGGGSASMGGGSASTGGGSAGGGTSSSQIPIFIAQGGAGRLIISCDDGHTWVGNHAWDLDGDPLMCGQVQTADCYNTNCNYEINNTCSSHQCCNDTPDVPKGVAFGDGKIVATWGWGQPGAVRTSTDGISWTTTHPNDSFGGVAFGNGHFVAASRSPIVSTDGMAWTSGITADFRDPGDNSLIWSVRRFAFLPYGTNGVFLAVASGNTGRDVLRSTDNGQTWVRPTTLPSTCANINSEYGGITFGGGIAVIVDEQGNACRSTDGGDTWTASTTGAALVISHGVWTGSEFWYWGDDQSLLKSADGKTWTKTPMATPMRIGAVVRGPTGTLVAADGFWQGEGQMRFLRSTDGLTWELLSTSAAPSGHSIFYMAAGLADPSTVCPGH